MLVRVSACLRVLVRVSACCVLVRVSACCLRVSAFCVRVCVILSTSVSLFDGNKTERFQLVRHRNRML